MLYQLCRVALVLALSPTVLPCFAGDETRESANQSKNVSNITDDDFVGVIAPDAIRNPILLDIQLPSDAPHTPSPTSGSSESLRADAPTKSINNLSDDIPKRPELPATNQPVEVISLNQQAEPLPTPLLSPDKDGTITEVDPKGSADERIINPFDAKEMIPRTLSEAQFKVGAIIASVRTVAIVNGRVAVRGDAFAKFTVVSITANGVILQSTGKYFLIPPGKTITIRTPQS